jgi:hypothetical protein
MAKPQTINSHIEFRKVCFELRFFLVGQVLIKIRILRSGAEYEYAFGDKDHFIPILRIPVYYWSW